MARFMSSMEFLLCSLNVVIIGYGGYLIMKGQMDYRDLITFSLYITAFVNPMRKLATFAELFSNGFAGLKRFVELMRTEPSEARVMSSAALSRADLSLSSLFLTEAQSGLVHLSLTLSADSLKTSTALIIPLPQEGQR